MYSWLVIWFFCSILVVAQTHKTIKSSGGDFSTFASAITWLGSNPPTNFTGGLVFDVDAGVSTTESITLSVTGTSSNPIVFQKSGSGSNPVINAPVGTGTTDYIVTLNGVSYITFDGIDLKDGNTASATVEVEAGYLLKNSNATTGCQYNTIKNCKVTLNRANSNKSYCFVMTANAGLDGGVAATQTSGTNSNNKFYNIACENAFAGYYFDGTSATYPDLGTEIGTTSGGTAYVGSSTAGDIGLTGNNVMAIRLTNQSGVKVFNVEVRNLTTGGSGNKVGGILLENTVGTSYVYNCKVHDVYNNYASSSSTNYLAYGIRLDVVSGSYAYVYNNFIYNIDKPSGGGSGSTTMHAVGIITGVTAGTSYVYNNTIYLNSAININSACILHTSSVAATLDIRNNILYNVTAAQSSLKHYCIFKTTSTGTMNPCDYNDLYVANTNGVIGFDGTADRAAITDWRGKLYTTNDNNSISGSLTFVTTPTDLHISSTAMANAVINRTGTVLAAVTSDIDGATGNRATYPDIGADEFDEGCTVTTTSTVTAGNYDNLTINGSSITATLGGNTKVWSGLTITNGSLAVSSYALSYNTSGTTLTYNGSATQTTTTNEWPSSNGPQNLVVNNSSGFRFNLSRTLSGDCTITSGDVQNSSGMGVTLTMSGSAATISVAGSITGTNVGSGNDINLLVSGTQTTISGAGSLCRFLNVTVNLGSTLALARQLDVMYGTFTENGSLQINSGGSVSSGTSCVAPTYGSSATLIYNSGGTYGRGFEWSSTSAANPGYPANVTIQNSTTLNYTNGQTSSTARYISGNLNISSGNLYMDYSSPGTTGALTVGGNVTMAGNLSLGDGAGGDIIVGGNWTRTSGTLNDHGRAIQFTGTSGTQLITDASGAAFSIMVVNKAAGSVQFANNVTITGTTDALQILNAGTIDLNGNTLTLNVSGGNIKVSGGSRSIAGTSGTVSFPQSYSITSVSSGTLSFGSGVTVTLAGGVNFGSSVTTINGTLQINSGGYVNTNASSYASGSILKYNSGSYYGRGLEWSSTSGAGYPYNVQISTNGTSLDLGNGGSSTARQCAGSLTIDANTTLTMNQTAMSAALTALGDIASNGTLILSGASGGDLKASGNVSFGASSTFTPNGRAIFFIKDGTQTLTHGSGMVTIPYIIVGKSGGSGTTLQLNATDVTASAPNTGHAITFVNSTDILDLNSRTLTIGSSSVANDITGNGTIKGSSSSNVVILGTGSLGTVSFTSGSRSLNNFTINRTSSGSVTLGSDLTINGALTQTEGELLLGSNTLTLNGTAARTNGTLAGGSSANISIGGTGALGTIAFTSGSMNLNNLTLNRTSSGTATLGSNLTVNGTLTVTAGDLVTNSNTVTLGGSASLSETVGNIVLGNIATTRTLSQSVNDTFGGIGAEINATGAAPGSTTVLRVTGSAMSGNSYVSIKRYYDITPATNANLLATLVLHYDNRTSELNGLTEDSLEIFKSTDGGSSWILGTGTLDKNAKTITLTGVSDFSRWTAGAKDNPLPLELHDFNSNVEGRNVSLNWTTATEVNSYKFVIERSKPGTEKWSALGEVRANNYSNSPKYYSYVDKNLNTGKYKYRLKMVDNDGTYEYSKITAEAFIATPAKFNLLQNYPNPFNPTTKITYALPADCHVSLELYSISGQKVATLINEDATAGYFDIPVNMSNYGLASGAYIYRLNGKELNSGKQFNSVKKMMYLK
jgi:hypothetical protein